jgi:tyrosyl-tRNA synthetase
LLAQEIVRQYHGQEAVKLIEAGDVPEFSVSQVQFPAKLSYLLNVTQLCKSSGEGRRKIQEGGVRLDGDRITDVDTCFGDAKELHGRVLQLGKNKFVRFVP